MKKIAILLILSVLLIGCAGFGLDQNLPKRDMTVTGFYLKESQDQYYMIQKSGGRNIELFTESDTITINGKLYTHIFFAKLDPKNFRNGYDHLDYNFGYRVVMFVRGDFERKKVPGEGPKEYLVLENVVGIE